MKSVVTVVLALCCSCALAVEPGAYSIIETMQGSPKAKTVTNVYCISAEQIDERGFLVPLKTLAKLDGCTLTSSSPQGRDGLEWRASCPRDFGYQMVERNTGKDFDAEIKMTWSDFEPILGSLKATSLGRPCQDGDKAF